jgi:hypothetical protein
VNTLLLDVGLWDLVADANGNIAMASPPYALAQDVASAVRVVLGEVFYDTTQGIPWLAPNSTQVLGSVPSLTTLKAYIVNAALTVPNVVTATCIITGFSLATRQITGQVQFTDSFGNNYSVNL